MHRNPLIFALKRGSLDDGEGIRSVVFIKGCPLRCSWCHNPESYKASNGINLEPSGCLSCGECVISCPTDAITLDPFPRISPRDCQRCGNCIRHCLSGALTWTGEEYSDADLLSLLEEDRSFYQASGGGVTFSGGEPLLFPHYIGRLARQLKRRDIAVSVQTCGYFNYIHFRQFVVPYIDTIYFDVKLVNDEEHITYTGRSNQLIIENLLRMVNEDSVDIIPRTPLIPGITDSSENIHCIKELMEMTGLASKHVFLPYNGSKKRTLRILE